MSKSHQKRAPKDNENLWWLWLKIGVFIVQLITWFLLIIRSLSYLFWRSHLLWSLSCSTHMAEWSFDKSFILHGAAKSDWSWQSVWVYTLENVDVSFCVPLVLQINWKSCILSLWEKASAQSLRLALSFSLAMPGCLFWGCLSVMRLNNVGKAPSLSHLLRGFPRSSF